MLKVNVDRLAVRENPDMSESIVSFLNKGDIITPIKRENKWIKHEKGWSLSQNKDKSFFATATEPKEITKQRLKTNKAPKKKQKPSGNTVTSKGKKPSNDKNNKVDISGTNSPLITGNMSNILKNFNVFGMPYQFLDTTDPRYGDSVFGRMYTSKIVAKMPVLMIGAGRPLFMDGFSKGKKEDVITGTILEEDLDAPEQSGLESLFSAGDTKMYSFRYAYDEYYDYVNTMLNAIQGYLGLSGYVGHRWEKSSSSVTKSFISSHENVAFYLDSETQIQETFSNTTAESKLSAAVNGMSDIAREFQFLMGGTSGTIYQDLVDKNLEPALQKITDFTSKYSNIFPSAVIDKITGGFENLVAGGKMSFPEIWNDSEFSRSYDVNIKLRSPDADNESIFLNILVPLAHLICLAAPQHNGAMGYQSPFLVRCHCRGFFSVDMGIITSLSIDKGDKGKWNLNGLPTEVNISMTIKDLYELFAITTSINPINNSIMLDYLATLCGIDSNSPDIFKSIHMGFNNIIAGVTGVVPNGFLGVENNLSNILNKIFN